MKISFTEDSIRMSPENSAEEAQIQVLTQKVNERKINGYVFSTNVDNYGLGFYLKPATE